MKATKSILKQNSQSVNREDNNSSDESYQEYPQAKFPICQQKRQ